MLLSFFIISYTTISSITARTSDFIRNANLQDSFDDQFCNKCHDCSFNKKSILTLTKYDVESRPIEKSKINTGAQFITDTLSYSYKINNKIISSTTSYLLVLPDLKMNNFKGLIAYFHPTVFNKQNVPSSLNSYYKGIAGFYASKGFALLMIDQIGLGIDWKKIHPYVLFPVVHAQTMALCLDKQYDIISKKYGGWAIATYPVGYSQGASYALWFNYCIQKGCLNFRAPSKGYLIVKTAGLQGAYDLNGTIYPFLIKNVNDIATKNQYNIQTQYITGMFKPGLATQAIVSFNQYSSNPKNLKQQMNSEFYQMICTQKNVTQSFCNVLPNQRLNIQQALRQQNVNQVHLAFTFSASAFTKQLQQYKYPIWETLQVNDQNSVLAFVKKSFMESTQFQKTLQEASILYKQYDGLNKTLIFTLKKDSIVSPNNNFYMKNKHLQMQQEIFQNENFHSCITGKSAKVDHLGAQYIGHIYAASYFERDY